MRPAHPIVLFSDKYRKCSSQSVLTTSDVTVIIIIIAMTMFMVLSS